MARYSRLGWSLLVGGLAFALGATTASAQGRGKGHDKQEARDRDDRDDRKGRKDHDDHDRVVVVRRDDDHDRDARLRHDAHGRVVVVRRGDHDRDDHARRDDDRHAHVPPGQAKKRYTSVEAVDVTRDVMHRHGYEVARVERHGDDQVVYYYRGNMGRGRGHGPLERMVIHPDHDRIVVRQAPPQAVFAELRIRLGM